MDATEVTDRQREVATGLARGESPAEIGKRLGISPATVKAHADTLRRKLGVAHRRQIPAAYREQTGEDLLAPTEGAA
jgi:DNA-binding NarL/FixJ family response regulator